MLIGFIQKLRRGATARACIVALTSGLLFVAADSIAQQREAATPLSIGETFTIRSQVLGETRRINVYMPAVYTARDKLRLPVLYMPDGGLAEDFLHIAGLLQVSVDNMTMRPFILVGIENTQRRRDMTGPTEVAQDKAIAPVVGGSAAFRRFIRTELMPQVRDRYRTTQENAIVGESLAGLFVVETLLLEPDLFDTGIAIDPSLWWNDSKLIKDTEPLLTGKALGNKTLYLVASGESGEAEMMQKFSSALTKANNAGMHWHVESMPEENHGTVYQPAALKAFRTVFKPAS
ncbi:alpha/beta hydrolase [Undibacterium sp. TJN25]|uniref:alpha/beta hydrolase n=1 Tax=Undibacterium sp. TJN25 TaxID=3413056 RepID=UPI003BF15100